LSAPKTDTVSDLIEERRRGELTINTLLNHWSLTEDLNKPARRKEMQRYLLFKTVRRKELQRCYSLKQHRAKSSSAASLLNGIAPRDLVVNLIKTVPRKEFQRCYSLKRFRARSYSAATL
jgi:hypothetical protein